MGLTSAASRSMLSRAPEKFSKRMRVCPSFPTRYATSISVSGILWTDAIRFFWEGEEVAHGDGDQLSVVSPPIPLLLPRISQWRRARTLGVALIGNQKQLQGIEARRMRKSCHETSEDSSCA
jgi:hypothetical protein